MSLNITDTVTSNIFNINATSDIINLCNIPSSTILTCIITLFSISFVLSGLTATVLNNWKIRENSIKKSYPVSFEEIAQRCRQSIDFSTASFWACLTGLILNTIPILISALQPYSYVYWLIARTLTIIGFAFPLFPIITFAYVSLRLFHLLIGFF